MAFQKTINFPAFPQHLQSPAAAAPLNDMDSRSHLAYSSPKSKKALELRCSQNSTEGKALDTSHKFSSLAQPPSTFPTVGSASVVSGEDRKTSTILTSLGLCVDNFSRSNKSPKVLCDNDNWLHFPGRIEGGDESGSHLVESTTPGSVSSTSTLLPSLPTLSSIIKILRGWFSPITASIPAATIATLTIALLVILLAAWGVGEDHFKKSQRKVVERSMRHIIGHTNDCIGAAISRAPTAQTAIRRATLNAQRQLPTVEEAHGLEINTNLTSAVDVANEKPFKSRKPIPWWQYYADLTGIYFATTDGLRVKDIEFGFNDGANLKVVSTGGGVEILDGIFRSPPSLPATYHIANFPYGTRNVSHLTVTDHRNASWYHLVNMSTTFSSAFSVWEPIRIGKNLLAEVSLVGNLLRLGHTLLTITLRLNLDPIISHLREFEGRAFVLYNGTIAAALDSTSASVDVTPTAVAYPARGEHPSNTSAIAKEQMTDAEHQMGCWYDENYVIVCPHTPTTFGFWPLKALVDSTAYQAYLASQQSQSISAAYVTMHSSPSSVPPLIEEMQFGIQKSYLTAAMPILIKGTARPHSPWMLVVAVPMQRLEDDTADGRTKVALVTTLVAIIVLVLCSACVWLIYLPVARISSVMALSQKLSMDDTFLTARELLTKDKDIKRLDERLPSRWSDIYTIQTAHWATLDELKELRAYVPEHIKAKLAKSHHQSTEDGTIEGGKGVPPATIGTEAESLAHSSQLIASSELFGGTNDSPNKLQFEPDQAPHARSVVEEVFGLASEHTRFTLNGCSFAVGSEMETLSEMGDGGAVKNPLEIPSVKDLETISNCTAKYIQHYEIPEGLIPAESPQRTSPKPAKPPIIFADSCLVDRDITVVHLNIIAFHHYARFTHGPKISSDYAEFITFINTEAKRFGGILESFFGDKLWISFNATTKCAHHPIAASYFAFHVTSVINRAALGQQEGRQHSSSSIPKAECDNALWEFGDPFAMCQSGINCGVATGRAFVGPLGNQTMRRHNIISNAIPEAAALERQALQYAGSGVLIGGDMIPAIEGYCQYLLLDASLLPGSFGKRRRIACLKGPMIGHGCDPSVVKAWLVRNENIKDNTYPSQTPYVYLENMVPHAVPSTSRYHTLNESFNALLEGQTQVATTLLHSAVLEVNKGPDSATGENLEEYTERKADLNFMASMIFSCLDRKIDGRTYRSTLGEVHRPFIRPLTMPTTPLLSETPSLN